MAILGNPVVSMIFPEDYFTGDGITQNFTLSRTPASVSSILVTVGGVKQISSPLNPSYTLNGNILQLASAPLNNTPIEVLHMSILGQVNVPGNQTITKDMLSLPLANSFLTQFTANGLVSSFGLVAAPIGANSVIVTANGVAQYDYSINNNTITFNYTPPANQLIRVHAMGLAQSSVPNDGSVTSAKLGSNLTLTGNTITTNLSTGSLTANIVSSNTAMYASNGISGIPIFSAWQSVAQTLVAGTPTIIQFQLKDFDTSNSFNNTAANVTLNGISANGYSYAPNVAGYYRVSGGVGYATLSGSQVQIYKNGIQDRRLANNTGASVNGSYGSALVFLNGTSDFIQLYANVATGQALSASSGSTYFQAELVRGA